MEAVGQTSAPRVPTLPEMIARTLRHEVGDLLQTVYATVAILQERLPGELQLERRILKDLRGRAETCKNLLDTVHDLVCPLSLTVEAMDPADVVTTLVNQYRQRYPQLEIADEVQGKSLLQADLRHLTQIANRLLSHACQRAQHQVRFRSESVPGGEVRWTVLDDGPAVPAEQLGQLLEAFKTTRPGSLGLDLALARKLVDLHGGRIAVRNRPEGGLAVEVVFPSTARSGR